MDKMLECASLGSQGKFKECELILDSVNDSEELSLLLTGGGIVFQNAIAYGEKELFFKYFRKYLNLKLKDKAAIGSILHVAFRYSFQLSWVYDLIDVFKDFEFEPRDEYKDLLTFLKKKIEEGHVNKDLIKKLLINRIKFDENEKHYYLGKFLRNGHKQYHGEWAFKDHSIKECPKCGFYNSIKNTKCDLCDLNFVEQNLDESIPFNDSLKICTNCNHANGSDFKFCSSCGNKLS